MSVGVNERQTQNKKIIIKRVISGSSLFNAFLASILFCLCVLYHDYWMYFITLNECCPSLGCTIWKSVNEIAKFYSRLTIRNVFVRSVFLCKNIYAMLSIVYGSTQMKKYSALQLFYLIVYTYYVWTPKKLIVSLHHCVDLALLNKKNLRFKLLKWLGLWSSSGRLCTHYNRLHTKQ